MAVIHHTELRPSKLELLTSWLPTRRWYAGGARRPVLVKAGGFRLDDPEGEVGIEFMVVADTSGIEPATYLVPMTYRGAPLDGAEHALVGTMEHGVLGRRWAYDGCHDPVLIAQLLALIEGRVEAQDQNTSDMADREVTRSFRGDARDGGYGPALTGFTAAADDGEGTELPGPRGLVLRVHRVLRPVPDPAEGGLAPGATGHVAGSWRAPDGNRVRGLLAELRTRSRA